MSGVRFNGKEMLPIRDHPVCDFCLSDKPVWDYPCTDFAVLDIEGAKVETTEFYGSWAACETCSMLIEHDDKAELAARAARGNGTISEVHIAGLRLVVNNFMRRRSQRERVVL